MRRERRSPDRRTRSYASRHREVFRCAKTQRRDCVASGGLETAPPCAGVLSTSNALNLAPFKPITQRTRRTAEFWEARPADWVASRMGVVCFWATDCTDKTDATDKNPRCRSLHPCNPWTKKKMRVRMGARGVLMASPISAVLRVLCVTFLSPSSWLPVQRGRARRLCRAVSIKRKSFPVAMGFSSPRQPRQRVACQIPRGKFHVRNRSCPRPRRSGGQIQPPRFGAV